MSDTSHPDIVGKYAQWWEALLGTLQRLDHAGHDSARAFELCLVEKDGVTDYRHLARIAYERAKELASQCAMCLELEAPPNVDMDLAEARRWGERYMRQLGAKEQGEGAAEKTDFAESWPTVSEAARVSDINKGLISRAADDGALKSNGKKGRGRRIDSADLIRWKLKRLVKPEPAESYSKVESDTKKHVSDYRNPGDR